MKSWDIRLEGRAWNGPEAFERHECLPVKVEMVRGQLLLNPQGREALLGALLEQVGAREAVRLGNPSVWKLAIAELDAEP